MTVVLVDGAGPSFSAGYDLSDRAGRSCRAGGSNPSTSMSGPRPVRPEHAPGLDGAVDCSGKTGGGQVQGYCLAGGTELMSMCDIAFVNGDDRRHRLPAPVRAMSTPDTLYFPGNEHGPGQIPPAHREHGQRQEAAAMGWVAKSFPPAELEDQVQRGCGPWPRSIRPCWRRTRRRSIRPTRSWGCGRTCKPVGSGTS